MAKIFRFCPFCAAPLVTRTVHHHRLKACPACGFIDYQNARPTAGALVVNEKNEVLLAKRAVPPKKGYWNIPGGFLDKDEHPRDGVIRELKEETGLDIEPSDIICINIGTYNDPHQGFFYTLNIYYTVVVKSGEIQANDDASELRFFPMKKLPPMAFACDVEAITARMKRKETTFSFNTD